MDHPAEGAVVTDAVVASTGFGVTDADSTAATSTSTRLAAVHVTAFKSHPVTIERQGDTVVITAEDGSERRGPVRRAAITRSTPTANAVLSADGRSYQVETVDGEAVRAMFPEADHIGRSATTTASAPTDNVTSLLGWAKLLTVLYAIVGVIGGIVLAAATVEQDGFYSSTETHPYVGWGIGAVITVVCSAVVVYAVLEALGHIIKRLNSHGGAK